MTANIEWLWLTFSMNPETIPKLAVIFRQTQAGAFFS